MRDPARSSPVAAAPRCRATPLPRLDLADELDRLTPRLDELIRRARVGRRTVGDYHDLEEEAQMLARDLLTPFRGPRAAAARTLWLNRQGW